MSRATQLRIKTLEELLEKLEKDYKDVAEKRKCESNPQEQNNLDLQLQQLGKQIDENERDLQKLKNDQLYRDYWNKWEEKIPKIDFFRANGIFRNILRKIEYQEGAALFFLKKSRSMGGKWCIKNIKSELQSMGSLCSPCEFNFLAHQQANQTDFLNFLAQKFVVEPYPNAPGEFIDELIKKICCSLYSGNILFIQIDIYSLNPQNKFLDWFLNEFWCPLVRQLPKLSQKHPLIRFVAVLSIGGLVPKDCLPANLSCKQHNFDPEKFLELPLEIWREEHIRNWLFTYSELTHPDLGYTPDEIKEMATNIYQEARGEPSKVYSELMDQMRKIVS